MSIFGDLDSVLDIMIAEADQRVEEVHKRNLEKLKNEPEALKLYQDAVVRMNQWVMDHPESLKFPDFYYFLI